MNPIKPTIKSEIFSLALLALSFAASVYFYLHFPERVATHWNLAGEPDGWSGRAFGAFFFPPLLLGMYLLFVFLPRLDPKKERYAEFAKPYAVFRNAILAIMALIYFVTSLNNLGFNLDVGVWTAGAIGVLFIILGNYLGKLKMNWFVGIKTPWTLSSEAVWNKTHRVGGWAFVLAGLVMIATGVAPIAWRLPLFVFNIIMLLFMTLGYSYFVYLAEKKKK